MHSPIFEKAKDYYKTSIEDFEKTVEGQDGLKTVKSKGGNYESIFISGEADGEEGYVKFSRVGKTVLVIETQDKEVYEKADKAIGY